MEHYQVLKTVHVTTVAVTLALFVLRGVWMLMDSSMLRRRWVRIAPHINDTVLLLSALALAWMFYSWPRVGQPWITAKVVGLVVYIGLGTVALKRGRTKAVRVISWIAALLVFAYIAHVAVAKQPWPW